MKFGENLKIIRKRKNMSQEVLAEKMNVSRQAVSKWENSESYPEINNILELCKIFNCKINDLVHTDMSDIGSLDKNIVMDVVKLNEKKQKQLKGLSNVISMIGKIGKIVLYVAIPFVILMMILVPYLVNNIQVNENKISFKTENIKVIDENKIKIFDVVIGEFDADISDEKLIGILNDKSNITIISCAELSLVLIMVNLVIMIIILTCVEKMFNNIKNNNTPFTIDNVNYIKKISYLMIALIIITPLGTMPLDYLVGVSTNENIFDLISILEILIIFSMSYIFEYGYEIQKDTKGKIYN